MNEIDALLIMLEALDGTLSNYHLQHLYVEDYQLHLAADRAREPLDDFEDRIQERIKIRIDGKPVNSKELYEYAAKNVIENPTESDIVNMCLDIASGINETSDKKYGKGADSIFGDICEHLDFIIALFSKQKKD